MTQETIDLLRSINGILSKIESLMRDRLPIPLPADTCAGCHKAMDHFGPSPYCSVCQSEAAADT